MDTAGERIVGSAVNVNEQFVHGLLLRGTGVVNPVRAVSADRELPVATLGADESSIMLPNA